MTQIIRYFKNIIGAAVAFFSKDAAVVAVVGGADGPTSVFLAGKISHISVLGMTIVGICVLILIFLMIMKRKKKN